jgi:hypothetical protein
MPVTQATALVALRERLSETAARAWSDDELVRYLNEAAREVAIRSECFATTTDIPVLSSQYFVFPPTNAIRIHRVEWIPGSAPGGTFDPVSTTGSVYPLAYTQINNMDAVRGTGQQTSYGTPSMYSTWGHPGVSSGAGTSGATGTFRIILYPRPQTAGYVRVYYYRFPVDMAVATPAAVLDLPQGWEHLAYDYAEFRAKLKDGDQNWQVAKTEFEGRLETFKSQFARLVDENDTIGIDAFWYGNQYGIDDWNFY